ncbi:SMP-30/gluconolactonase/LRE family protein [Bradyrhizobium manausense]|uniref:IclR family transcriptional regulator domain-containing protein n=1 Tax=Bradyrhizobium manausense TaxID=989370 RepID=UPI001BA8C486|nr:IclR family transcriptional regulator C-terminal domain-containing protein [Bradyrhizobium manausense]MBR0687826.1 SMP-30/gluconolactonase/LRE family protein [Bradyrhizobium manausense]
MISSEQRASDRWSDASQPERANVPGTALIGKAFELLDAIGSAPGLVSVPDLIAATGWPRATVYRILSSITAHGFVRFDPVAQGYTLGYRFLELAQNVWAAPDLAAVASVELQRLRDMTGETAYLAVPHDGGVVALGKFESAHDHRSAARLGVRKPMHCTSQGKAILAFSLEAEVDQILAKGPLDRFTPYTIVDRELLKAQLTVIRSRGYAIDDEEILLGTRCVGAPILDSAKRPVAAISVAGPVYRLSSQRVEQLGPEIATVAHNIGQQLRGSVHRSVGGSGNLLVHPSDQNLAFYGAYPQWHASKSALIWADRLGPTIYTTRDGGADEFRPELAAPIDGLILTGSDVVACMAGQAIPLHKTNKVGCVDDQPVAALARLTAVCTDPGGILWTSQVEDETTMIGPLVGMATVEAKWSIGAHVLALAWSPTGNTLYAADPRRGTIYAAERGGKIRVFCRVPRVSGEPCSLAVDVEDRLWVALDDGWSVARLTADGEFERVIALPVPRPTGIAFGGDDMRTLFITTARIGLARNVLEKAPLSGRLLMARPGVAGWETVTTTPIRL